MKLMSVIPSGLRVKSRELGRRDARRGRTALIHLKMCIWKYCSSGKPDSLSTMSDR